MIDHRCGPVAWRGRIARATAPRRSVPRAAHRPGRLGEADTLRLLQHHAASGPADARARARYYLGAAHDHGWLGLEASAQDAVREYERGVALGSVDATVALAALVDRSDRGIRQNRKRAKMLLVKASNAGCPRARYELGRRMIYADGCARDEVEGVRLLGLSAAAGLADAEYELGRARLIGLARGTPSEEQARVWLVRAAARDHAPARALLAALEPEQTGAVLAVLAEAAGGRGGVL